MGTVAAAGETAVRDAYMKDGWRWRRSGAPEQHLPLGDGERLFETHRLGARHVAAECRQFVRAAPLVFVSPPELANQPVVQQTLDDAVQRAGAETNRAVGQ